MMIERINANVVGATSSRPLCNVISKNNGITMISLIITIVILLILSGAAITSIKGSNNVAPYNNMIADITLLEDKILVYYNKYGEIPKTDRNIIIDGINYYEIDLSKLDNLSLNYGRDYEKNEVLVADQSDVYVVNDSIEVYYLKGIEKSEKIHHTRND